MIHVVADASRVCRGSVQWKHQQRDQCRGSDDGHQSAVHDRGVPRGSGAGVAGTGERDGGYSTMTCPYIHGCGVQM